MRNNKFLVILLLFVFLSSSLFAKIVNVSDARTVALNYHSEKSLIFDNTSKTQQIILSYIHRVQNKAVYYVFDINSNGFVIVSAEDRYYPILGFSFDGNYKPNDIAPAFSDLLQSYESRILQIRNTKTLTDKKAVLAWTHYLNSSKISSNSKEKTVPPLLKCKWGQGTYYNDSCPAHTGGPNGHCVVGCVATAMAQLMYYYKFPSQGNGTHSYYHPYYVNISANFGNTSYDFSNMSNSINNNTKAEIARLSFHAGVAVEMYYTPPASSATLTAALSGMKNYFNYSIRAFFKYKYNLSDSAWVELLKNDLDADKPVLYRGSGSQGGHAFICDGYSGNDKFHFNWGWNGSNNGYYYLDNFSFSSGQAAIFDLVPYGHPYCTGNKVYNHNEFTFNDGSGPSRYWNDTDCEWIIAPNNGLPIRLSFLNFNTESGKDVVTIYDGDSKNAPVLGTYSGSTLPPVLYSSGAKLLITFQSDNANNSNGWTAFYSSIPLGFDENSISAYLKIYPNPAEEIIKIDFGKIIESDLKIQLFDIAGKTVITKEHNHLESANLDISKLTAGIYLLKIISEKEIITRKVCVK